jgi:hypothetical protein
MCRIASLRGGRRKSISRYKMVGRMLRRNSSVALIILRQRSEQLEARDQPASVIEMKVVTAKGEEREHAEPG